MHLPVAGTALSFNGSWAFQVLIRWGAGHLDPAWTPHPTGRVVRSHRMLASPPPWGRACMPLSPVSTSELYALRALKSLCSMWLVFGWGLYNL